jgi:hypothetical protein
MNIGYIFLICAWILFFASGFWYGFSGLLWGFILLLAVTITLLVRYLYYKHKYK